MKERRSLQAIKVRVIELLSAPECDVRRSNWDSADEALREVNRVCTPEALAFLFAPTNSLQEVSLASGWANEFLQLGAEADALVEAINK